MKRAVRILFSALAVFLPSGLSAQYLPEYRQLYESETASVLRRHVSFLSSDALLGRAAGSEGEAQAAAYVRERLKEYGVDLLPDTPFGLKKEQGDTLTSGNVIGFVQGCDRDLSQRYLVVGARLDNVGFHTLTVDGRPVPQICPGANGNASGLAMLVELARMVHTQSLRFRRSVLFVAFGASGQGFAGAWYFMDRSFPDADRIDAMVNLDGVGFGRNGFYAYTSSNTDLNALLGEVNATLQPVRPEIVAAEPYPSDHRVFYSREVPSVLFSTGRYPEFNTARDVPSALDYEGMERETEYVFNFLSALACKGEAPRFLPGREEEVRLPGRISFYDCDEKPRFFGSSDLGNFLRKWVYQYLRYPHAAVEQGIQGRVTLSFTIDERGKVRDVQVTRGAHELLDAEAVRVVQASPDWTPGKIRGKRVAATVSVPVDFRLERTGGKHKLGIKR